MTWQPTPDGFAQSKLTDLPNTLARVGKSPKHEATSMRILKINH